MKLEAAGPVPWDTGPSRCHPDTNGDEESVHGSAVSEPADVVVRDPAGL